MPCSFTPSRCHVDLAALARNFKKLGAPESLMPVIKSDAYGHGLLQVAETLAVAHAENFAVGAASEGQALREAGFSQRIVLLMGCIYENDWHAALENRLVPLVGSFEALEGAASAAAGRPFSIAIKCDTGMGRLGFNKEHLPALLDRLGQDPNLEPAMLVSHLACADMPEQEKFTESQTACFEAFYEALRPRCPNMARSLYNSAATMAMSENRYELARPGLALYGGNPFANTRLEHLGDGLEWAMSVSSPIVHIRELAAGQSISYGRIFTAPRTMRVAVVACGYATGISRGFSNRISMLVNGQRARQVGRICMSMLMLDISSIKGQIRIGDQAWAMGGEAMPGHKAVDAQELAQIMDTIPYEILCLMGSLNPRVYHGRP